MTQADYMNDLRTSDVTIRRVSDEEAENAALVAHYEANEDARDLIHMANFKESK